MKGGVEARDLDDFRMALATELQHRDLGREMFRRVVHYPPKFADEFIINNAMCAIAGAAMDDPMADGDERGIVHRAVEPTEQDGERSGVICDADRLAVLMVRLHHRKRPEW